MEICFMVGGYPTKDDPVYTFIRPVVTTMADRGIRCTVIAPQNVLGDIKRKKRQRPIVWEDYSDNGNEITIIQPKVLSLSSLKINGTYVGEYFFISAIRKAMKKYAVKPDLMYGHFWDEAIVAAIVTDGKLPVIAVSGESTIRVRDRFNSKIIDKYLSCIKGLICVSTKNLNESNQLGLLKHDPQTIVLPNAIDADQFYPMNRAEVRRELGIVDSEVVASFVGAFSERKGINRVIEAAKAVPNLKLILVGGGSDVQDSKQILFKGRLPHNEICKYLNASDFFVLPTQAEGCCNAIVEALACGLPVISSNLEFNWDVLNAENSILINPDSIEEISTAMKELATNPEKRNAKSEAALKTAASLKIENRCGKIIEFILQTI